jgi:hypothetical protein
MKEKKIEVPSSKEEKRETVGQLKTKAKKRRERRKRKKQREQRAEVKPQEKTETKGVSFVPSIITLLSYNTTHL